jgi:hypothetical protein
MLGMLGGGTLAGRELAGGGPKLFGTNGGGGIDGAIGACGLRGAIPDAVRLAGGRPDCDEGICGAIGATGAEGVWGRTGSFG